MRVNSPPPIGTELMSWSESLATCSETDEGLTRSYLTDQHRAANELVQDWMQTAGMACHIDPVGNLVGRYEGAEPGLPALMTGSHLDTVRNAGKYDGMLGVLTGIACVKALHQAGERPNFAIEVVGFANEEGVRFPATLTGSRAVAGTIDPDCLSCRDAEGITMAEAMRAFGLDPARVGEARRRAEELHAFVELHIEQGPVLESKGLALGTVTAISGATRFRIDLFGMAGHAGTVPMSGRRDALAAAAEAVLLVERRCTGAAGLVGTVGKIEALPGAANVIPGQASFSLDIRAESDAVREAAVTEVIAGIRGIAERRGLEARIEKYDENPSCPCSPWLIEQLERAIADEGQASLRLPSGAGHDAMTIAEIAEVGMIFVRCKGGISHNPAEAITAEDAELGARALLRFIRNFRPRVAGARSPGPTNTKGHYE